MDIQTFNPTNGQLINTYSLMDKDIIKRFIQETDHAFQEWREYHVKTRAAKLKTVASILEKNKKKYAELITLEMGKPIRFSMAEIEKCQWVCDYFAEHGEAMLAPRPIETDKSKSYIAYQPLGIIFAIMPWNFPFWQLFRFAAPALTAGNAVLLRHAPNTTGCGLAIEQLFQEAGFPINILHTLIIDNDMAAEVIKHPKIKAVTLTGSPRAGSSVGSVAGSALKKTVLELGGNDPYIILEDADLENAAKACLFSRLNNSGQVCIAAKRIIVMKSIFAEFEKLILKEIVNYKMGDPFDYNVNLGPLARADLRETVHQQVQNCIKMGASRVIGGEIPKGAGFFYPPTLLKNISADMPANREEIFGPVIALFEANEVEEAIRMANDSIYGLSAAIFTKNIEYGESLAVNRIEAGTCYVNGFVASDPRLPFGGIKASGFGRELAEEGIKEFTNIKTICVK